VLADRYRIVKSLGDGGMGTVYLAEQTTLRKKLAIKVLKHEHCREKSHVERFLQEARAASMIAHENIVSIIDFGAVPGGSVFFAMEYLEGEDLSDTLRREGRMLWPRVRDIALQVVQALAAAHARSVIHRDLKPANCFLIKHADGSDYVKLLDFGIAKVLDPEMASADGLTRTGAVFGTAKYMAPEQASGERVDPRTDIYALGIVLYEMLSGTVPFPGQNFMQVLSRHLTEAPTPLRNLVPDVPPPVEALVMRALAKRREDRYQTMKEFEAAIVRADVAMAAGGPHGFAPVGDAPTYPPSPVTAAQPTTALAAPPVTAATGVSAAASSSMQSEMTVTGEAPRSRWAVMGVAGLIVAIAAGGGAAAGLWLRADREQREANEPQVAAAQSEELISAGTPLDHAAAPEAGPPATPAPQDAEISAPQEADAPAPQDAAHPDEPARDTRKTGGSRQPRRPGSKTRRPKPAPEPTPAPPPLKPLGPPSAAKKRLSDADISKGLSKISGRISACKRQHGGLPGMRVRVQFSISGTSGAVIRAKALLPHAGTPLGTCIAGAVKQASFPKAEAELIRRVTREFKL
jgi:serine/threonine-protein kinase